MSTLYQGVTGGVFSGSQAAQGPAVLGGYPTPRSQLVGQPVVTLRQSFDGGTGASAGATLSAANTDGPGSTPLNQVSIGASATAVFDSTASDGTLGCQFTTPATATTAYAGWTTAWGTQTTTMMWADVRVEAAPAANLRIFGTLVDAATLGAIVVITPTRQIVIANSAGTTVYTSATNVVPLGQHFRLEFAVTHDAASGTAQVKLYNATGSAVADLDSGLLTGLNTGAQSTILRYGIGQSGANLSVRLDRLGGSNAIVWGQGAGGASSVTGDASLAVTTTVSAGGVTTGLGDTSLAITTTTSAAATLATSSGSTLTATTTLTAAGTRGAVGDATGLAVTTSVTTAGSLGQTAGATLAVSTTVLAQFSAVTPPTFIGADFDISDAGTASSFIPPLPAGWQAGDLALLFGHVSATNLTMTTPAGWTVIPGPTWPVAESTNSRMYGWYRYLQAGDTAPTVTCSGAVTGGAEILDFRGVHPTSPLGQVGTATANGTALNLASLAGVLASSLLASVIHARVATGTIPTGVTPDAAYTEQLDVATSRSTASANMAIEAATRSISSAGSYGGESFAVSNTITSSLIGALVEVKGAPPATAGAASLAVTTTVVAAGQLGAVSTASLAVTTTVSAAGARTATAQATLAVTTTVSAAGTLAAVSQATLAITTTVSATGTTGAAPVVGQATLAITTTVSAAGVRGRPGSATLAAVTTITAAAVLVARAGATLAVVTTLDAGGTSLRQAGAVLAVVTTLLADAVALGGVIYRPDSGVTARPGLGSTTRPTSTTTARPTGTTVRPTTGVTVRP